MDHREVEEGGLFYFLNLHNVDGQMCEHRMPREHLAPCYYMGRTAAQFGQGCFGSKRWSDTILGRWLLWLIGVAVD